MCQSFPEALGNLTCIKIVHCIVNIMCKLSNIDRKSKLKPKYSLNNKIENVNGLDYRETCCNRFFEFFLLFSHSFDLYYLF